MPEDDRLRMYFNPQCSTCKRARDLLDDQGQDVELVNYLEHGPDRPELERVLRLLRTDDPRAIMRSGEPIYDELGLDGADRNTLLDAMVRHPILIQRPIAIRGDRAVVGRPPERILELLEPAGH